MEVDLVVATEVVGCGHLSTTPNGQMVFLDAVGLASSW
jgi:hypothetical protein